MQNKNLDYGVNYAKPRGQASSSWDVANEFLYQYFREYDLIDYTRPRLRFSHPGAVNPKYNPYLFTVWETTKLPSNWLPWLNQYEHIFVPSQWNCQVFQAAGCRNVSYVPLGFEPAIYHPGGKKFDFQCEKPFLMVCHYQHRKALDITMKAWEAVQAEMPSARLFLFGHGIPQDDRYEGLRITRLEPSKPWTYDEMAALYRGAHTLVLNSRSEGFGFPIIEAMGCGTLTIVPDYGATAEFISGRNCLALSGTPSPADYKDKGFEDVGLWWEPSLEHLKTLLLEAYHMSEPERVAITQRAREFVLSQFTWQQVALKMYNALKAFQRPKRRTVIGALVGKIYLTIYESLVAIKRGLRSIL